ncbi:hypothetical protein DYB36_004006 [Aphanomyces astaci]|uniref:Uncharacterized protein n=1 Tax=Aphanomyces astaci TaxID=112090 RepID=A0A397AJG9_APHAT|nr:hypothetical protein DYB36_004006 [Aphanomyces astaci]
MDICVWQHNKFEGKWVKQDDAHGSTSDECAQLLQFRRLYARLEAEIAPTWPTLRVCLAFVDLSGSEHAGQKTDDEQQECQEIQPSTILLTLI